jgi:hypothetical protein
MRYSLAEQETIINFDKADQMASVYTHEARWQKHIETKLGIKPLRTIGPAREYEIPKSWLRLPQKPRRLSPARKEAATKTLAAARTAQNAKNRGKALHADRKKEPLQAKPYKGIGGHRSMAEILAGNRGNARGR